METLRASLLYSSSLVQEVIEVPRPNGHNMKNETTKVEQWIGSEYACEALGDALIESWEKCGRREELRLPEPNPYIATVRNILAAGSQFTSVPAKGGFRSHTARAREQFLPSICIECPNQLIVRRSQSFQVKANRRTLCLCLCLCVCVCLVGVIFRMSVFGAVRWAR